MSHWLFYDVLTTFLGLEHISCDAIYAGSENGFLSDFIKNILISVLKLNEGLMDLDRHEVGTFYSATLPYNQYGTDILCIYRNYKLLRTDSMSLCADSTGDKSENPSWKDHCIGWSQWLWEEHNNSASAALL